ncbi:MAE_28990/MAE_18760 family HEPN-like nuclease [Salmonella enterica subsp. enterica serovar Chester]|uniref:MAE_28990/MAE_18760 family HEPN-like nuclease n=1 Tax=Salmonella enterica TaxID=28901 RepID=UPI0033149AB0
MHDAELLLNKLAHDVKSAYHDSNENHYNAFLSEYHDNGKRVTRSQYLYNITIISLYGLFEQFIESQIEGYVKLITTGVKKYRLLPQKMRDTHCDLTLKYAQKNLENRYLNEQDKEKNHQSLIMSLYHSLGNGIEDFSLVEKVYSNHSSNFRYELITTLFNNIGVDRVIDKTLSIEGYPDYYKEFFGLDDSAGHNEIVSNLNEEILELVQRRNRIAHGATEDNILSYKFLKEKCVFFDKLCYGIFSMADKTIKYHLMEVEMENNGAFEFEAPTKLYDKISAFGFSIKKLDDVKRNKCIYEGQVVYLKSIVFGVIEKHYIESIFYNGQSDDIFETTENFDFSIKLKNLDNIKRYKGYIFYFS